MGRGDPGVLSVEFSPVDQVKGGGDPGVWSVKCGVLTSGSGKAGRLRGRAPHHAGKIQFGS